MSRFAPWIVVALAAVGSAAVIVAIDRNSHSVSDTLYRSVIQVAAIWLLAGAVLLALRRPRRA